MIKSFLTGAVPFATAAERTTVKVSAGLSILPPLANL
jgi:hypothetical protein